MKLPLKLSCLLLLAVLAGCTMEDLREDVMQPAQNQLPIGLDRSYDLPAATMAVFQNEELTEDPTWLTKVEPVYPQSMRRLGAQGEALIRFIVPPDGIPCNIVIISANDFSFGEAAAVAVSKSRFHPGMANGHPVVTLMEVPIYFALHKTE